MRILFTTNIIINNAEDYHAYEFVQAKDKYFENTYKPIIMTQLSTSVNQTNITDLYTEENQLRYIEFEEAVKTCKNCQQKWF